MFRNALAANVGHEATKNATSEPCNEMAAYNVDAMPKAKFIDWLNCVDSAVR